MALVASTCHALQACLSAYTGLLSYTSIVKLQKYEEKSKKAAQYSNTAEHQLHKTRTTQTSGALATLSSLVSSVVLTAITSTTSWQTKLLICAFNVAAISLAYRHVSNFWRAKAKVPLVTDFNDAITTSNQMLSSLSVLVVTWGLASILYGFQLI